MARTINQILATLNNAQAQQPALANLNSPSQVSIYGAWKYIQAVCIMITEQLWDIFQSNLENQIANAPAWTNNWLAEQTLKFQYDSTNPQIVSLDQNFVPSYQTIIPADQIVSQVSVNTTANKIVEVLVATGTPPQQLSSGQTISLQGYLDVISPAGIQIEVNSYAADLLYINGICFYDGQYQSTIQTTFANAVTTWMQQIPFDGFVELSSLEVFIKSIPGVNDWQFSNVALRANSIPINQAVYLVKNNTTIYPKYQTYAGYVIGETTAGYTLPGSINFIVG